MLKIKHVAVCMLALAMLSAGCTNYSGNTYSGSQVRSAQTVQYGTVVSQGFFPLGSGYGIGVWCLWRIMYAGHSQTGE